MAAPQSTSADAARTTELPTVSLNDNAAKEEEKTSLKQKLWPFGKKKDDKKEDKAAETGLTSTYTSQARSTSPAPAAAGMSAPTSPDRRVGSSSSPRVISPASSQIFERNVQEESLAPAEIPSAIPSHIATENHIPAALDAASSAITNQKLDPDNVAIVTHIAHQPAAVSVAQGTGVGSTSGIASSTAGVLGGDSIAGTISPSLPATSEEAASAVRSVPTTTAGPGIADVKNTTPALNDGASSYGDLNPTDVRRLSFISFADVVHHEQAQSIGSETASHLPGTGAASPTMGSTLTAAGTSAPIQSFSPALGAASPVVSPAARRSPSPARAASPSFLSASAGSPKMVGSSPSPPTGVSGELAVESLSQALRKTGSGDLSAARERHATDAVEGLGVQ